MKLSIKNGKLCAYDAYYERGKLKAAGWRWNPAGKNWWTDVPERAEGIASEAEIQALRDSLCRAETSAAVAVEASRAVASDLAVPCPSGRQYLPYQRAGVSYALGRSDTLIGDEMGLGKTIQAIGVINVTQPGRVLIVCPASLKLNWARELGAWLTIPRTVGITDGKNWVDTQIVIINYDILNKYSDLIKNVNWDLLIVDECHYLKNPKTARTKQVLGAKTAKGSVSVEAVKATRRLFLTGTPICNRPVELWPLVHAIDPQDMGRNWRGYVQRYCNGHQTRFGWDVSGASNLVELQTRLRSKFMVRRLKSEVLTELPPKRRQVIELLCNGARPYVEAELAAWETREKLIKDLEQQVEKTQTGETAYSEAVEKLRSARQIAFAEMAKARHDTAVAKTPSLIVYLHDLLDEDPDAKIVFFAHHHDVLTPVFESFADKAVLFTGETKMSDRQAHVDRFQSDPKCQLFVASITAAGVGITLTASSHVVFGELDWTPGNVSQAEDRTHRIGQKDNVLVQHVVLNGSLDAKMARTLIDKQEVIDQALNNKE